MSGRGNRRFQNMSKNRRIPCISGNRIEGLSFSPECDTFNDLSLAFDKIYAEVKQGTWKPHVSFPNLFPFFFTLKN